MTEPRGEWALIDWIRRHGGRMDPGTVPVGPGDDMAVVRFGDEEVLVTVDVLLEGTHFAPGTDPRRVGYKAMAVSLSDVAAMAALPVAAVAWVGLPAGRDMAWAEALTEGLWEAAGPFGCPVVGGDVTSWAGGLTIGTTVLARPAGVRPVLRGGARPGDAVFVTGRLGGSLEGRHLAFTPRIREARRLAEAVELTAMIDLSDGLSSDLAHIADESGAGAEVDAEAVPVSEAARRASERDGRPALEHALDDGEDFELCFTVGEAGARRLEADGAEVAGVALARVGRIVEGSGLVLVGAGGARRPLERGGWEHFR